ncbi:DUF1540 domain-containing protein [Corynebacterium hansenii]|uniref:DUF1540 domain-containing protein n=1 Tax=Corynebacterium hansenii TaxID=394964 RepID=A0ABV7ZPT3_9CORY|nr:DUF1540 domain-containing protein [Corynebacterium hansenii]WJZ00784.1 hypothetical protein CHAN_10925 [Corynebacterium hansenii]
MSSVTKISSCTTTSCAYNNDGCTAFAVNVGGDGAAACTTFATIDLRAGLSGAEAQVGACKRLDCTHNENLMCGLADISVSGETAQCDNYQAR